MGECRVMYLSHFIVLRGPIMSDCPETCVIRVTAAVPRGRTMESWRSALIYSHARRGYNRVSRGHGSGRRSSMRTLYRAMLPYEWRFWLYKQRNRRSVRRLREAVNESPKGNFSLRRCDELEAIFVHIPKAAGTSVALSLFGELPFHYTAIQYRVIFGRSDFRRYFKFAFVRNPWDRLYSAYRYLRAGGWDDKDKAWAEQHLAPYPDFNAFVLDWLTADNLRAYMHFRPQVEFVCDRRGRPLIDYLGYFETIEDDFRVVSGRLGTAVTLDHVNASGRADYRSVYSAEAARRVAEVYRRDIAAFGYAFEGLRSRRRVSGGEFESA